MSVSFNNLLLVEGARIRRLRLAYCRSYKGYDENDEARDKEKEKESLTTRLYGVLGHGYFSSISFAAFAMCGPESP